MAKSGKATKQSGDDFAVMQGGTLDGKAVQRQFGEVQRKWLAEVEAENAIRQEAAKHISQIGSSSGEGESNDASLTKLRQITEKLAARKLPAGINLGDLPGVWGSYTLRFTPPYLGLGTSVSGQITSVTGNPTISSTGVDNLGQLSCSVDTDVSKPSGGTASNLMGVYFKPLFSNATARITFSSQISFSWYVNSIRNKLATSRAQGLIQLYQYDHSFQQPSLRRGAFIGWNEVAQNSLDFDFISEAGPTWYLEAPVSSAHFYFVVISFTCTASGFGWPGSLAGARAMVTVPSITVGITANLVAEA
jgi:hypothetical protein